MMDIRFKVANSRKRLEKPAEQAVRSCITQRFIVLQPLSACENSGVKSLFLACKIVILAKYARKRRSQNNDKSHVFHENTQKNAGKEFVLDKFELVHPFVLHQKVVIHVKNNHFQSIMIVP